VRIVNIGTFLLPIRFSLKGMMEGDGRRRLAKALTAHLSDFQSRALTTGDGLFLDVQSSAHQRMETMVFSGVTVTEAGDAVRLYVSSLAVGFVVVEMNLPDDLVLDLDDEAACERFKEYEGPITERVEALLRPGAARSPARPIPVCCVRSPAPRWTRASCCGGTAYASTAGPTSSSRAPAGTAYRWSWSVGPRRRSPPASPTCTRPAAPKSSTTWSRA